MAGNQKNGFEISFHEKDSGSLPRRLRATFARMGYAARKGTGIRARDVARAAAAAQASCGRTYQPVHTKYIVIQVPIASSLSCPTAYIGNDAIHGDATAAGDPWPEVEAYLQGV